MKGEKTLAELSSEYKINHNVIMKWKKQMKENMANIFIRKNEREPTAEEEIENLYKEIGKIQVENAWLKKKLGL